MGRIERCTLLPALTSKAISFYTFRYHKGFSADRRSVPAALARDRPIAIEPAFQVRAADCGDCHLHTANNWFCTGWQPRHYENHHQNTQFCHRRHFSRAADRGGFFRGKGRATRPALYADIALGPATLRWTLPNRRHKRLGICADWQCPSAIQPVGGARAVDDHLNGRQ